MTESCRSADDGDDDVFLDVDDVGDEAAAHLSVMELIDDGGGSGGAGSDGGGSRCCCRPRRKSLSEEEEPHLEPLTTLPLLRPPLNLSKSPVVHDT
jgi:hypothetical protein